MAGSLAVWTNVEMRQTDKIQNAQLIDDDACSSLSAIVRLEADCCD
jgi:hypothetical protein